jgi:tetratricopeptide (TPR) repeat protein
VQRGGFDETGNHDWRVAFSYCSDSADVQRASALAASSWEQCDQSEGTDRLTDLDRVIQACTEVIEQKDNANRARAYSNRCRAYTEKNDNKQGLADCEKAIELDPKSAEPYTSRCWIYIQQNNYDLGISDCDKAVMLDPKFFRAYRNRCAGFVYKGEYDRAITDCNEAVKLAPGAYSYTQRCWAYVSKGEYDLGIADCDEAIEFNPQSGSSLQTISSLLCPTWDAVQRRQTGHGLGV